MNAEHLWALSDEVDRLPKAGFIRETLYPEWLANPILIKKKNEKWIVCNDFTNLNKACPKNNFSLLSIVQMVDATTSYELSFMDVYSGYNQIKMHLPDENKTTFTTERAIYCYKVMPFRLKNAGATFQRMVSEVFKESIGTQ